jgi:hypothetical protein
MDINRHTDRREAGSPRYIPAAVYVARHRARQRRLLQLVAWLSRGDWRLLALGLVVLAVALVLAVAA